MKKIIVLIMVFLNLNSFIYAQNFANKKEKITIYEPEKSLKIGEKLQYSLEWLGIPVGKIILNVKGIEKIDGNECYHITAYAIPNKFFAKFYDVEYTVHTYIDKDSFYTHRFEKTRRIKDKSSYVVIDFDRQKKEAIFKTEGSAVGIQISPVRKKLELEKPKTVKILTGAQDLFSSFYYLRLLKMKENESYSINIYYGQRNWSLNMRVEKPFFKDIRNKGTFAVFGVSMDSDLNEFILGKRRLFVYFTADSRRIPLEFRFGTGIGSVRGIIQKIPS